MCILQGMSSQPEMLNSFQHPPQSPPEHTSEDKVEVYVTGMRRKVACVHHGESSSLAAISGYRSLGVMMTFKSCSAFFYSSEVL